MENGKNELDRLKEEVKWAFKKASVFNDIEQTPIRAAGKEALFTALGGATVTGIIAATMPGYVGLAVAVSFLLLGAHAREAYNRQAAVQKAYRSLPPALREDAPETNVAPK